MSASLVVHEDGSATLRLRYDPRVVDALKRALPPGERRWSKPDRAWLLEPGAAGEALRVLDEHGVPVRVTDERSVPWASALFAALPDRLHRPAYRAMARVLHPDAGGDARRMQELNDAHQIARQGADMT